MKAILRHAFRAAVVMTVFSLAIAGASIWFLPSTSDRILWNRHIERSVGAAGTPRVISSGDLKDLFSKPGAGRVQCRVERATLSGTIVILRATSLEYKCVPAGWTSYRNDHGLPSEDIALAFTLAFTHDTPPVFIDFLRRFPLEADQDPLTWRPKPHLAHSFVRTAEPHRNGWDFELVAPYWIVTTVMVAPAALLLIAFSSRLILKRANRARRRNKRLCESCGYDLRASQNRCPECNHPIPTPANPPPTP